MNDLFSLKNKVAVVTGAAGLLGKEHCSALAEAGASVVVTDIDENKSSEIAGKLSNESCGFMLDVTDKKSISELKKFVLKKFGQIDILVNNAAINDMFENSSAEAELSKFENYPLEMWRKSLDVNLTGVFLCSQILGSRMAEQGNGSIINIASTYGMVAPDQSLYKKPEGTQSFYKSPVYSSTKGAVIMFTKFLAAYWGNKGVRVNSLSPGGVENSQDDYFIENYSRKTPLGKMSKPGDYRGAIVFLASDASSYMTGANLVVDGGWTIW
ncbi:MAG: SDR family oxidoreductase [Chlorobi bacterium]|nr:SDR family oxidoreductase [Chlorobiota bacterium]MCI0715053.1 SDR family oxidoreductase [Chlorobiota bacterium]